MICKKCNCEIPETSLYCPECGELIGNNNHKTCPNCKNVVFKDDKYCKICGYKLNNNQTVNLTLESINKFNFLRLKNYKKFTTIITLIVSIIMFVSMFLPLIPIYNKSNSEYEILDVLVRKENYPFISIVQVFQLLIEEISGYHSFIGIELGYNIGLLTYLFLSLYYLAIAIFTITLIVHCIIGLFKNRYFPINKKILGYLLVISIVLSLGGSCTGIGNLLITIGSFVLLIYNFVSEIISKEISFNKRKFIYKLSLFSILSILVFCLGLGTYKTSNDLLLYNLTNFKHYYSNIISSAHLQTLFIKSEVFTFDDKSSLFTLVGFYELFGVASMVLASISIVECIMALTFPYIKLPIRKTIFGFICYVISLVVGFLFIYYSNMKLQEAKIEFKFSVYITFAIYVVALIFVLFAKKGYYKDNKNAIN